MKSYTPPAQRRVYTQHFPLAGPVLHPWLVGKVSVPAHQSHVETFYDTPDDRLLREGYWLRRCDFFPFASAVYGSQPGRIEWTIRKRVRSESHERWGQYLITRVGNNAARSLL